MIRPTREQLLAIDLTELHKRTRFGRSVEYFNAEPGQEHYRLLAYLSTLFNGVTLTEVGTLDGCGALALSYNPNNDVKTYDVRFYEDCADLPENVERKIVDDDFMDEVVKSPLIFYDTDHNGVLEREFVKELVKRNYKGIVVWDDIALNQPMKDFWSEVNNYFTCEDWTDLGHHSGTGITIFK